MRHAPVTVVVPMRDEAASLPGLLEGLARQTLRPAELVFVDTGSRDASAEQVRTWWAEAGWPGASCRVIEESGAFPGGGRNAGVSASGQPWIAFIDCGIVPDPRWLEELLACAGREGADAVLGMCRFEAKGSWARAFCALSYGVGTRRAVLPASIFCRTLFDRVGLFDPALRAGEDILWLEKVAGAGQALPVCESAQALYRHFPDSVAAATGKWYQYERAASTAGIGGWRRRIAVTAPLWLFVLPFAAPAAAAVLWLAYLVLRGVADPVRRSAQRAWWRGAPLALAYAPFAALAVDTSRAFGSLAGLIPRAARA